MFFFVILFRVEVDDESLSISFSYVSVMAIFII